MKSNYTQENQRTINKINRNFFENIAALLTYLLIFRRVGGKFRDEHKFFTHLAVSEKLVSRLLSIFSLVVTCACLLLSILYFAKRFFLRRYWYIRSGTFFLNNRWIITLNCLLKICGYVMLVTSFVSLPRLLVTLNFISLFSFLNRRRKTKYQLSPSFFSWKDTKLRSLLIYSLILAVSFPVYNALKDGQKVPTSNENFTGRTASWIGSIWNRLKNNLTPSEKVQNELEKIAKMIPSGGLLFYVKDLLVKSLNSDQAKGGGFLIILLIFIRSTVNESIYSFENFWKEVNTTTERINWFKYFANSQLALKKKKVGRRNAASVTNDFPILCYDSFILNPNFIKQSYTESMESFDENFVEKVKDVRKFIKLVDDQVTNTNEKMFIFHWVFNYINSFKGFYLYNSSIEKLGAYRKHTTM